MNDENEVETSEEPVEWPWILRYLDATRDRDVAAELERRREEIAAHLDEVSKIARG